MTSTGGVARRPAYANRLSGLVPIIHKDAEEFEFHRISLLRRKVRDQITFDGS